MLWLQKVLFVAWIGSIGGMLGWILLDRLATKKPVRDLPPEIRAQLDGCKRCNLSQSVCRQHPSKAFESCGCGGTPVPCPSCQPSSWNVAALVEENARLRERLPW